jgi:hypothetical protein
MKPQRSRMVGRAGLTLALIAVAVLPAVAGKRGRESNSVNERVREAMEAELRGAAADRAAALASAIEAAPDDAAARWQAGFVKQGDEWMPHEAVAKEAVGDERLKEYTKRRDKAAETVAAQLELADWCRTNKLVEQEQAHLMAALQLAPNHAGVRARLGHVRVGDLWLDEEEVREAREKGREAREALKKYSPMLEEIRDSLAASKLRRDVAVERLKEIDDPAAIPAMELVLSAANEEAALLVVEALAAMPAPEASLSLARHALFAESADVRDAAVDKLKKRDFHSFAPALLDLMRTPWQAKMNVVRSPGNRLLYRHAFYSEDQDRGRLAVFDHVFNTSGDNHKALSQASNQATAQGVTRQVALENNNDSLEKYNRRICELLAEVTGEERGSNPEAWWQWWIDFNELYVSGEKPVTATYKRTKSMVHQPEDRNQPKGKYSYTPPAPPSKQKYKLVMGPSAYGPSQQGAHWYKAWRAMQSCLAAGTPVWTIIGPKAVEKIRVGDLVLSQDPESGELAYKPVIGTTVRPPVELLALKLERETIHTTGGHPFWVAGDAWRKARELEEGTVLHSVGGPVTVIALEPEEKARPAYNLIVADSHSYFVGESKILSHDNTVREPTDRAVPGFAKK